MADFGFLTGLQGLYSGPSKREKDMQDMQILAQMEQSAERRRKENFQHQLYNDKINEQVQAFTSMLLAPDRKKINKVARDKQKELTRGLSQWGGDWTLFMKNGGQEMLNDYKNSILNSDASINYTENMKNGLLINQILTAGKGNMLFDRDVKAYNEYYRNGGGSITYRGLKDQYDYLEKKYPTGQKIPFFDLYEANKHSLASNFFGEFGRTAKDDLELQAYAREEFSNVTGSNDGLYRINQQVNTIPPEKTDNGRFGSNVKPTDDPKTHSSFTKLRELMATGNTSLSNDVNAYRTIEDLSEMGKEQIFGGEYWQGDMMEYALENDIVGHPKYAYWNGARTDKFSLTGSYLFFNNNHAAISASALGLKNNVKLNDDGSWTVTMKDKNRKHWFDSRGISGMDKAFTAPSSDDNEFEFLGITNGFSFTYPDGKTKGLVMDVHDGNGKYNENKTKETHRKISGEDGQSGEVSSDMYTFVRVKNPKPSTWQEKAKKGVGDVANFLTGGVSKIADPLLPDEDSDYQVFYIPWNTADPNSPTINNLVSDPDMESYLMEGTGTANADMRIRQAESAKTKSDLRANKVLNQDLMRQTVSDPIFDREMNNISSIFTPDNPKQSKGFFSSFYFSLAYQTTPEVYAYLTESKSLTSESMNPLYDNFKNSMQVVLDDSFSSHMNEAIAEYNSISGRNFKNDIQGNKSSYLDVINGFKQTKWAKENANNYRFLDIWSQLYVEFENM